MARLVLCLLTSMSVAFAIRPVGDPPATAPTTRPAATAVRWLPFPVVLPSAPVEIAPCPCDYVDEGGELVPVCRVHKGGHLPVAPNGASFLNPVLGIPAAMMSTFTVAMPVGARPPLRVVVTAKESAPPAGIRGVSGMGEVDF